ncbi:hypothetical protein HMPREF1981_01704 [Bacteroides pyogenes F0041]|uniref:Uncharacterized protein n=1 Tax=Bacteroides pyogenes F0041 TaxID=1321819 RepID=U2C4M2_9BACE|nr:hypothetical protein HMPREF1981_01704 [Bacteroides pyogenes F0041]
MSESLPVIRCACVVSPKAYSLPGLRVWFHQKFTRHIRSSFKPTKNTSCGFTKSLPVTRSCVLYGFDVLFHLCNRICRHTGFYSRVVSTLRNALQTELLQTRTNAEGASYKTFNCILKVIINYHYGWHCFRLIEEAFRRFFRFLKTPKSQKATMSPFFCHFSWR